MVTNLDVVSLRPPVEITGIDALFAKDLRFVINSGGEVYAVWIEAMNRVYVSRAAVNREWNQKPSC